MQTLLLDTVNWDWLVDASGNIAVASEPYSQAQDAASAIRTFQGECYYDTTLGVPYWDSIFGKTPPVALMKALFNAAALTVPGVATSASFIQSIVGRKVTGQVQISNGSGTSSAVGF